MVLESPDAADKSLNIPVATEATFEAVWLLGADAIHADYVPLFQSGIEVTAPDADAVVGELIRLEGWLASASLDATVREQVLERAGRLRATITELFRKSDRVKIYIG